MVVEQLLSSRRIKSKILFSIVLGFAYALIAYFTSKVFFPDAISVAMLFLISILLMPTIIKLISIEERRERKEGIQNFFRNHKKVLEVYFFMFIGAVIGYLAIGLFNFDTFNNLFSYQLKFLGERGLTQIADIAKQAASARFAGILTNNLTVAVTFFILSFFYGAGGVFLLVLNASIFSAFVLSILSTFAKASASVGATVGAFSLYLLPELFGFLLAAFAGGVISKAILTERMGSDSFKNVIRDATLLLVFSFVVLTIAALLEAYVSAPILIGLIS